MGMLEKALEGGKFGVTVEMAPPRDMILPSRWRRPSF